MVGEHIERLQTQQDLRGSFATFMLEIQRHRALVAVDGGEVIRDRAGLFLPCCLLSTHPPVPCIILVTVNLLFRLEILGDLMRRIPYTFPSFFNLDDVCSIVCEHLCTERSLSGSCPLVH